MSAATSLLTPDEQFIQEVLRSGRATRQEVSLKAIGTPDVNLQARVVHLDMDHCSRLERAAMEQGDLAPIVLFRASQAKARSKLWLADGHHRHHVYVNMLKPKRDSIPAYVIDSDAPEQEALEFATMCNREMCLGRSDADIKRAAFMLFANELWFHRPPSEIAAHIGCADTSIRRWLREYCIEKGTAIPFKTFVKPRSGAAQIRFRPHRSGHGGGFEVQKEIEGKRYFAYGQTEAEAATKMEAKIKDEYPDRDPKIANAVNQARLIGVGSIEQIQLLRCRLQSAGLYSDALPHLDQAVLEIRRVLDSVLKGGV